MSRPQPTFDQVFRDLAAFALRPEFSAERDRASREYFGARREVVAGTQDPDEIAFLEWLIFDRPPFDGETFVENFLHVTGAYLGDDRDAIASWADSFVSFYEVVDHSEDGLRLRDLLGAHGRDTLVAAGAPGSSLRRGALVMARALPWRGGLHLAGAVSAFPESAHGSLREFLEGIRRRVGGEDWARALKDILPALSRFQVESEAEDEDLFPGGYPDRISAQTMETMIAHGKSCMDRGEWTEALLCFQRVLFEEPLHVAARNCVGLVHLNRGDYPAARKAFGSILRTDSGSALALLNLGNVELAAGRLDDALDLLIAARERAGMDALGAHASFNIGLVHLIRGDDALASRCFREASRRAEVPAEGASEAALINLRIGSNLAAGMRWGAAATYLRKAVRLDPELAEARLTLAEACTQLGRYREAAAEYRRALRLGAGGGRIWNALGKCYLMLEQYGRAEEVLRRTVELLPGMVEAHDNLGQALMGQNRLEEARARFEVALYHSPRCVEALLHVGEVSIRLRDFSTSSRYLRRALRVAPTDARALDLLARVEQDERSRCI